MNKSTITREQLRALAVKKIESLKFAITQSAFTNIRRGLEDELQLAKFALAAMDSEPVAVTDDELNAALQLHRLKVDGHSQLSDSFRAGFRYARRTAPQPAPVVPDDVLDALQKVARIRLDLNEFDGDRRGIADCLSDAEEELIEVVNRCAAMLNGESK
ncbi:TPA: hypothetical protein RQO74_000199 [Klebsiella michiganensis]|nr:hypothetical protein [Klebsiella michiganensis]